MLQSQRFRSRFQNHSFLMTLSLLTLFVIAITGDKSSIVCEAHCNDGLHLIKSFSFPARMEIGYENVMKSLSVEVSIIHLFLVD